MLGIENTILAHQEESTYLDESVVWVKYASGSFLDRQYKVNDRLLLSS